MKTIQLVIIIICLSSTLYSQIAPNEELSRQLDGKSKFKDIKSTITSYFNEKISVIDSSDVTTKKALNRQYKFWNRYLWEAEYYTYSDGTIGNKTESALNGIEEIKRKFKPENNDRNQTSPWVQNGPISCTLGLGRIDEIAFHPTDPNIIYAGSPHGGLFKTEDGGSSWFSLGGYLPSLGVSGIAIDPSNPNTIYVLSGDGDSCDACLVNTFNYRSNGDGVYKSTDGGWNWQKMGDLGSTSFRGHELVISPTNPNMLLAATTDGLYRSINAGATWVQSISSEIWDVKFKPGDDSRVYVVTGSMVLVSNNNGATFSFANYSIPNGNRISIGVTPSNPNRVYLLAGPVLDSVTFKGLYTSFNSGETFSGVKQTPNVFSNTIGKSVFSDQSNYDNCIAVSPIDPNDIIVGGLCVWRSTDGGNNWNQISAYWPGDNPYMHPDIHEVAFNPLNQNLYCGNDGGFYRYNPIFNLPNWEYSSNNLTTSQMYHFQLGTVFSPTKAGCQDNGILQQVSFGNLNFGNIQFGDGFDVKTNHPWIVTNGSTIDNYSSVNTLIYNNGINRSVSGNTNFFANLAIKPDDENTIYAGYANGLFVSGNKGVNWSNLGANGDWTIEISKSNPAQLYSAGSGLMWRRNPNNTWTNITPPVPYVNTLKISDIDVLKTDENNLIIGIAGLNANAKVMISFNGGNNWNNITYNLPNVPIFSVTRDDQGGMYVGTNIGIFYKTFNGGTWKLFNNGLPNVPVTQLEIEKVLVNGNWVDGQYIHCSTFGRGLWKALTYTATCDYNLTLTTAEQGPQLHQALNLINSSAYLFGGVGTDIKYKAGNRIVLGDGFYASNGSKFRAFIGGCE